MTLDSEPARHGSPAACSGTCEGCSCSAVAALGNLSPFAPPAPSGAAIAAAPEHVVLAERAAPRYTSYPTAPHFEASVGAAAAERWLGGLTPAATLSLYLHVPFCSAMCHYCGCNTKVVRRREPVDAYLADLLTEIDLVAERTLARRVRFLHWGGGTPSMLGIDGLSAVTERLARRFDLSDVAEHAIELDPRTVTPALARGLSALGVSRASLGVQDFEPEVQAAIGRVQPYEQVARAMAALREAGIGAINMDLIYGLPRQRVDGAIRTAQRAVQLRPDRVALFGYAHVPWFKRHQKLIREEELPGPAQRLGQAAAAREVFLEAGFAAIGLDHFAAPHDGMALAAAAGTLHRNFQGYTTDDADALIGLGVSSISRFPDGYVQNAGDIGAWRRAVQERSLPASRGRALSADDRMRAEVIERLMCDFAVDLRAVAARHGASMSALLLDTRKLAALIELGLVAQTGAFVAITEKGAPFMRLVASAFDAYLTPAGRHSAAV